MPDDSLVPIGSNPGVLATLGDHLLAVPGAVAAIARLVGKTGELGIAALDIPVAKLQGKAQAFRDDQAARTAMLKIIAGSAAGQAVADPALLERAVNAFVGDRLRKQTNKEEVAAKTINDLNEAPPPIDAEAPAEDWMNVFVSHSEKATSDELRSLLSRVLAGEIRRKGSFSLRTLQFVTVIDQALAKRIEKIAGFLINANIIPQMPYFIEGEGFVTVAELASLGLITLNSQVTFKCTENQISNMTLASSHVIFYKADIDKTFSLGSCVLTSLGEEVFALLHAPADQMVLDQFDTIFKPILGNETNLVARPNISTPP